MTAFTGRAIKDSFKDLLQVSNANAGVDAVARRVEDGEGTKTKLRLSSSLVDVFDDALHLNGTPATSGGKLAHEVGGLEADISAVVGGDFLVGTATGAVGLRSGGDARSLMGVPPETRTLTAGGGLQGGGDLSQDRSFGLNMPELPSTSQVQDADTVFLFDVSSGNHTQTTRENFLKENGGPYYPAATPDFNFSTKALTLDASKGVVFDYTAISQTEIEIANASSAQWTELFLRLENGGLHPITHPANVRWPDGVPPKLSASVTDFTNPVGTTFLVGDNDSDQFGSEVAIKGNLMIIGIPFNNAVGSAAGKAEIYRNNGSSWQLEKLLFGAVAGEQFGGAVDISNDVAIVGASAHNLDNNDGSFNDSAGRVEIFRYDGSDWNSDAELFGVDTQDAFGRGVGIDGDSAIIGMPGDDDGGSSAGKIFFFTYDGTSWSEQTALAGQNSDARAGTSVAISNDMALATLDIADTRVGSVVIFEQDPDVSSWSPRQSETALSSGDEFGFSVDIFGDRDSAVMVIGAPERDTAGTDAGAVWFARWDGSAIMFETLIGGSESGERLGEVVNISDDVAIAGAFLNGTAGASAGRAAVYRRADAEWTQEAEFFGSNGGDNFGRAVAISGENAVVGAPRFDNFTDSQAGSAEVFQAETINATVDEIRYFVSPDDSIVSATIQKRIRA